MIYQFLFSLTKDDNVLSFFVEKSFVSGSHIPKDPSKEPDIYWSKVLRVTLIKFSLQLLNSF